MTALHDEPRAADRLDAPALTPDDLRVIQERYAVQLGALNQIHIGLTQLGACTPFRLAGSRPERHSGRSETAEWLGECY